MFRGWSATARVLECEAGFEVRVDIEFVQGDRKIGGVTGMLGFVSQEEVLLQSAILRHRLEAALSSANGDLAMNGAFQ